MMIQFRDFIIQFPPSMITVFRSVIIILSSLIYYHLVPQFYYRSFLSYIVSRCFGILLSSSSLPYTLILFCNFITGLLSPIYYSQIIRFYQHVRVFDTQSFHLESRSEIPQRTTTFSGLPSIKLHRPLPQVFQFPNPFVLLNSIACFLGSL